MGAKRKVQCTLTLMVGAENWVLVTHPTGSFKVPAWVELAQVVEGALAGWRTTPLKPRAGSVGVRIPLGQLLELEERASRSARRASHAAPRTVTRPRPPSSRL